MTTRDRQSDDAEDNGVIGAVIANRQGRRALQKAGVAIRPVVLAGVIAKHPMRLCSVR